MKRIISALLMLCVHITTTAAQVTTPTEKTIAILHTNKGDIAMELFPEKAPATVANFLSYAKSGFYDNTIFHRVVKRFVIQGGGYDKQRKEKPTKAPITNESHNGLHNDRWTVAMARTSDPDSATSQFYINMRTNSNLDAGRNKPGYTVFVQVIDGFHVVQDINKQPTRRAGGPFAELPVEMIYITSVTLK